MRTQALALILVMLGGLAGSGPADAQSNLREGKDAFGSWQQDAPGTLRLIRPQDLPAPGATASAANMSRVVPRPAEAAPQVPPEFKIELFAEGLSGPRIIRVAPNGDIFVAETARAESACCAPPTARPSPPTNEIFAGGLQCAVRHRLLSERRQSAVGLCGEHRQRGALPLSDRRPEGARRGRRPSCRSCRTAAAIRRATSSSRPTASACSSRSARPATSPRGWARRPADSRPGAINSRSAPPGATRPPRRRAGVRSRRQGPERSSPPASAIASAWRCSPTPAQLWCSTNERDVLGDNLPPDYVTRVREGGFYGWPWYYIGDHEDPRHAGERPDLKGKVTVPDVLIQPHSASLGMTFYERRRRFPPEYRGDAFAAQHGSWNRGKRTGYKVVRVRLKDGAADRRVRGFPHRLRGRRRRRLGPAGRRGGGARRRAAGHRRRQRHDLARQ